MSPLHRNMQLKTSLISGNSIDKYLYLQKIILIYFNKNNIAMDNQKPKIPSTKKYFLTPDTIYGNFKTIREVKIQTPKALESRWECLHIPTNTIRLVPAARLVYSSNRVEDPQKTQEYMEDLVKRDIHQQGIRNYLYRTYRSNAEKRGHEFNLTKDQFISIIEQPCFYCGLPPATCQ